MWNSVIKYYKTFNEKQKKILVYFISGMIIFFALLSSVFINLFEDRNLLENNTIATLTKEEAKEAIKILNNANIPINIDETSNGISILTDSDFVEKAKLELITNSISIKNSRGWNIFDRDKFGKTRFENNVDYIRSIEGEIEIALETLDIIQTAKVRVSFPKKSAFSKKDLSPSLTVVIGTKNNNNLSQKQIDSIRQYLLGSLIGLKNDRLKLLDTNGMLLEESNDSYITFEKAEKQARWKEKEELKLKNKIINSIAPYVGGVENVIAEVTVNFNFISKQSNEVIYDPKSKVARSIQENEKKEKDTRNENSAAGVPGVQSNLQQQNIQGESSNGFKEKKEANSVTNFEINKKIVDTKNNTFAFIDNIGVSVSFNSKPFNEEELQSLKSKIENSVKSIVNLNTERGDTLSVSYSKFFVYERQLTSSQELENAIDMIKDFFSEYSIHVKYIIVLFMLFAFYRFFIKTNNEIDLMEKSKIQIDEEEDEILKKRRERAKKQKMLSAQIEEDEERQKELNEQLKNRIKKDMENIGGLTEEEEVKFDVMMEELQKFTVGREEEIAILVENLEAVLDEKEDIDKLEKKGEKE